MEITEAQKKLLQAVKEARKMLEDDPGFDTTNTTTDSGVGSTGVDGVLGVEGDGQKPKDSKGKPLPFTLNTARKETDQDGLARGKPKKSLKEKKPTKAIVKVPAGEDPPKGFVQVKKGLKLAINPEAINDLEKFIADKHNPTP